MAYPKDEIEVTDAMIEAGAPHLMGFDLERDSVWLVLPELFSAMERARRREGDRIRPALLVLSHGRVAL